MIKTYLNHVEKFLSKNSPTILTGASVTGLVATTVFAIRATPKAISIVEDLREDYPEKIPGLEIVKSCWKVYTPTFLMGIVTASCMIFANQINLRRNAALASLYSISKETLKEYQEKTIEKVGETKEKEIQNAVHQEKIKKNKDKNFTRTEYGDDLCFEPITGRYFTSDAQHIRKVINDVNQEILIDGQSMLNTFLRGIGLDGVRIGDDLGWTIDDRLEIEFGSCLYSDGTPCLYLDYVKNPVMLPYCELSY